MNLSLEDCEEWESNRNKNPITGRKIKIDGPTYKKIEKQCNKLREPRVSQKIVSGVDKIESKREKIKSAKKKADKRKKIARKRKQDKIKERKLEKLLKEERRMDTPAKITRSNFLLGRIQNFIDDLNSTNDKDKIFSQYTDLRPLMKFIHDEENDFGIDSEDYESFVRKGKFKKTKVTYNSFTELLEELEDYKPKIALLHLHNFILKFPDYKELILNIIDKKLNIKEGRVNSLRVSLKKEEKEEEIEIKDTKKILTKMEQFTFNIKKQRKVIDKKNMLEKYSGIKKLFRYIYEPKISFGISSKWYLKYEDNDKKVKRDIIEKYTDLYKFLQDLTDRIIKGEDALLHLYHFIKTYPLHRKIILDIIDRDLDVNIDRAIVSDVFNNISKFEPTLAVTYNEKLIKDGDDWYISRKYDGIRCLIFIFKNKITFLSRTGRKIKTLGNLEKSLRKNIQELNQQYPEGVVLDGEIIAIGEDGKREDFKKLMKEILKDNHTIQNPSYRVFDVISLETFRGNKQGLTFFERYKLLVLLFGGGRVEYIRGIKQHKYTKEKFEKLKNKVKKDNWEGLMIRKDTHFKLGRTRDLMKQKTFFEEEFKVLGIEKDKKGLLEAIIINYNNTRVGNGFSNREKYFYVENPEKIVDKIVTVKYFEKDKEALRFPVFKGVHGNQRLY